MKYTKTIKKASVVVALIMTILINGIITINSNEIEPRAQTQFQLVQMNKTGKLKTISNHTNFKQAKKAMTNKNAKDLMITSKNSLSPSKLVALKDGGLIQSYPFRNGRVDTTGKGASQLAYIFKYTSMSGDRTYIPAHYKMRYIDTVENKKGKLLAKVEISGFIGYIDLAKTDLIPYPVIENKVNWTMGGKENYYKTPEKPNTMVIKPDIYKVRYNSTYKINEIDYIYSLAWQGTNRAVYSTGMAPSWLKPGTYYSSDGIEFYKDVRMTNRVKDNKGKPGRYINYFQFLPLRSKSNITADNLNNYIKAQGYTSSVYADLGQVFISNGDKYGVNPLVVHAMANLESAFGTSKYAKDRYNLFGWNAVDSNPDNATAYEGVNEVVDKQMGHNLRGYTSINDWRFFGYSVGNKGSGFNTMYASDPYWGMKIGSIAYRTDRAYGFQDLEQYKLGQLTDNTSINLRSLPNIKSGVLYKTKDNKVNQFITLNKSIGDFFQTYSAYPIVNGKVVKYTNSSQNVEISLDENLAHVHKSLVNPIEKIYNKNDTVTPEDPSPTETIKYRVIADIGLIVREGESTQSKRLGVLSYNSIIYGSKPSNGWVEITYKNKRGYVYAEYLEELNKEKYLIGDGNRDGKINMEDFYQIGLHIEGKKVIPKKEIKKYDTNKDGKIDMQDFYEVSFHILGTKEIKEVQGE